MPVILAFQSSPSDEQRLNLDLEVREIHNAIDPLAKRDLQIQQIGAVKISDVPHYIMLYKPDIFHFCGHGTENSDLIFLDHEGKAQVAGREAFETLFGQLSENLKCVILNACFSRRLARRIARYVPYVIGNSSEVRDDLAPVFTSNFYRSLSFEKSIPEAFEIAAAVVMAIENERINKPLMICGPTLTKAESTLFTRPKVKACFYLDKKNKPQKFGRAYKMKLWVDHLPNNTLSVVYNYNHSSIDDDVEEMENDGTGTDTWVKFYGNIQLRITIWFEKEGVGIMSSMTEALKSYYRGKPVSPSIREALNQIATH